MPEFVKISNHSSLGDISLSRNVFIALANEAVNKVSGAKVSKSSRKLFRMSTPTKVIFHKNGQVEFKILISLVKGTKAPDVCKDIQESIANCLMAYAESVPFKITIEVEKIV